MRELNVNEIKEVSGGFRGIGGSFGGGGGGGIGGGILGYLGGRIFDLGVTMFNNRTMRTSTGGQMQRGRRRKAG